MNKYIYHYSNANDYLNNYVIPDLVAFYLANGYNRHCLSDCHLRNYINSATNKFNCKRIISKFVPKVKEILRIKYNLIIVKDNPMILKNIFKIKTLSNIHLLNSVLFFHYCFILRLIFSFKEINASNIIGIIITDDTNSYVFIILI